MRWSGVDELIIVLGFKDFHCEEWESNVNLEWDIMALKEVLKLLVIGIVVMHLGWVLHIHLGWYE